MGTFKRQERAFWFILGALIGGAVVAAFIVLLETKFPGSTLLWKPGNLLGGGGKSFQLPSILS